MSCVCWLPSFPQGVYTDEVHAQPSEGVENRTKKSYARLFLGQEQLTNAEVRGWWLEGDSRTGTLIGRIMHGEVRWMLERFL